MNGNCCNLQICVCINQKPELVSWYKLGFLDSLSFIEELDFHQFVRDLLVK